MLNHRRGEGDCSEMTGVKFLLYQKSYGTVTFVKNWPLSHKDPYLCQERHIKMFDLMKGSQSLSENDQRRLSWDFKHEAQDEIILHRS